MKELCPNPKKAVEERIAHYRQLAALGEVVAKAWAKFEGKPVTKALETALEKAVPGLTASFGTSFGYNMHIWGESFGVPYANRITVYFGSDHHPRPTYTEKDFRGNWGCQMINATKWADELEQILPFVDELASQYQQAKVAFERAEAALGPCSSIILTGR